MYVALVVRQEPEKSQEACWGARQDGTSQGRQLHTDLCACMLGARVRTCTCITHMNMSGRMSVYVGVNVCAWSA